MFVDGGGWRAPTEPGGPPRRPGLTKRQENTLSWLILITLLMTLVAPIGGGTIIQAVMAVFER